MGLLEDMNKAASNAYSSWIIRKMKHDYGVEPNQAGKMVRAFVEGNTDDKIIRTVLLRDAKKSAIWAWEHPGFCEFIKKENTRELLA